MKQKDELDLDWLLFIQNFSLLLCLKGVLKYVAVVVGCKPILGQVVQMQFVKCPYFPHPI